MRKLALSDIKKKKNHYRDFYRRSLMLLSLSTYLSVMLLVISAFVYITQPEPDYYATNSASSVLQIHSMDGPNFTSKPLLREDLPMEMIRRKLND